MNMGLTVDEVWWSVVRRTLKYLFLLLSPFSAKDFCVDNLLNPHRGQLFEHCRFFEVDVLYP